MPVRMLFMVSSFINRGAEVDDESIRWWVKQPGPLTSAPNAVTNHPNSDQQQQPRNIQQVSMDSFVSRTRPREVESDFDGEADELLAIALAMDEDF